MYGYSTEDIIADLGEIDEEILLADGFEEALIGYAEGAGIRTVAVYDRFQCIHILMERDGMTEEDAEDHFQYNVIGSYVGETTPIFITNLR